MIPRLFLDEILRWEAERDGSHVRDEGVSTLAQAAVAPAANDKDPQSYLASARFAKKSGQLEEALAIEITENTETNAHSE